MKFIVPSFSGGRVAEENGATSPPPLKGGLRQAQPSGARGRIAVSEVSEAPSPPRGEDASATPSVIISTAPVAPAGVPTPASVSQSATVPDAVAWYVRPVGGGQFGPATTDVFRGWIEDGRVAADSWVWRTGWADWRPGSEAIGALAETVAPPPAFPPAPSTPGVQIAVAPSPAPAHDTVSPLPRHEPTTAEARRAEMRRRRRRNNAIAVALGVVALVVAVIMAVVLNR